MVNNKLKDKRSIKFLEALLLLIVYMVIFAFGIGKFPTGMSILLCTTITAIFGIFVLGLTWEQIFGDIMEMFRMGLPSVLVLLMVGFLSASWLLSGTIPTMIVYGLKVLNPSIFLVAAFVITGLVSISTGSSWTTVATFGLALMGIAQGLGIPVGLAGGAIVCGCWLGDKWSPLSDTTNLAAAVTGLDVFDVFKYAFPTAGFGAIITAIIFTVLGFKYSDGVLDADSVNILVSGIKDASIISPITLLPILLVVILSIKKKPVLPVLGMSVALSTFIAVLFQGHDLGMTLNSLYNGYKVEGVSEEVAKLVGGGGLLSVSGITLIIFCAFTLAGTLETVGVMKALVSKMTFVTKNRGSLILTTIVTTIFGDYLGGTAYTGVILNAGMYKDAFEEQGLSKLDLSRTLIEGAGHTCALVPWCGSHVMIVLSLGITWVDFIGYYYAWGISIALTILFGYTGWFTSGEVKQTNKNIKTNLSEV